MLDFQLIYVSKGAPDVLFMFVFACECSLTGFGGKWSAPSGNWHIVQNAELHVDVDIGHKCVI